MSHHASHEEILRDILVGDLAEESPEARRTLDSCPECRERLEELREVAADLDAAAERARAVLTDAREEAPDAPVPGADAVEEIIRTAAAGRRARGTSSTPPSGKRGPPWLGGIAALLLLGLVGWIATELGVFSGGGGPNTSDPILDGIQIELLTPRGEVDRVGELRWRAELPPGGWYRVGIHRAGASPGDPPLAESPEIEEPRWTPDASTAESWPQEIEWDVRVYDSAGDRRGTSGRASVRRRDP